MKRTCVWLIVALLALGAFPAQAAFHLFRIDQVYSNASGSIQYVVLREVTGSNGENFWEGNSLQATSAASGTKTFVFQANLPSSATASRSVLVGTQSFAALGLIATDFTVDDGFIPIGGGTLNYASGVDVVPLPALPTDGATAVDRNGAAVAATPKNFAGNTTTITGLPGGGTTPDLNQHGLTGSWFEPATSGQGIEIEIYPNLDAAGTSLVQGAWFTYAGPPIGGADRQRWYTFTGNGQSGAPSVPVTIYQNVGGNFDAPPITGPMVVGTGTLSFSRCDTGSFSYAFSDGTGRNGTIPLSRITPNVTCTVGTAPPVNADFGLSGNWFDPATSGQGFVFEVNPLVPVFFMTWYTYAAAGQNAGEAGQRWFTGQAGYTVGSASIPMTLYENTGGLFDQPTNPLPPPVPVGSATVTFASCTSAQLQFNFTGGSNAGKSGTITLSRIGPVPPGCVVMASAMPPSMGYPGGGYGPP